MKIISQIEFPELFPLDFIEPDVTIEVVNELKEIEGKGNTFGNRSYVINQTELWREHKDIGRYYVTNKNRVLIQPDPEMKEIGMV